MATAFVRAANVEFFGSTTGDLVFAATASNNDIIVCCTSMNGTYTITPPSGFTQKGSDLDTPGGSRMKIYWKRASGESSGTYTWGTSSDAFGDVMGIVVSGAKTSGDPWSTTTPSTDTDAGSGANTPASINADSTGAIAIGFARRDTACDWTPPAGWTEAVDGQASEAIYKLLASGGASGAPAFDADDDTPAGASWLGILEEAGGGGGATKRRYSLTVSGVG